MKNISKQICFIANTNYRRGIIAAMFVTVMALAITTPVHSGGIADRVFNGGAKSLAKQAQNLIKQAAALQEKALGIEEKALALSDRDRRAYQAELERLGFVPPPGLFNDAQALLTGAPEAPEGPGGILGFLAGIFGGGNTTAPSATASTTTAPPSTTTSGSGGAFTLTGIPSQYNGKYAYFTGMGQDGREAVGIIGVQSDNLQLNDKNVALTPIRNGRVTLPLWRLYANAVVRYTGNNTLRAAGVIITSQTSISLNVDPVMEIGIAFENVSFRNGSAERAWRNGTLQEPPPRSLDTWTRVANTTFDTYNINAIAYGNGRFVAASLYGRMAYSADGVSWTRVEDSTFGSYSIYAIASGMNAEGNNRWVAGGYNGQMAYSSDGVTWTEVADSTFQTRPWPTIRAIAWGGNKFVAVGAEGRMAYSADGESWTRVADRPFDSSSISAIAWGGNKFVAVGAGGRMAYSADGISWTAVADSTFGTTVINSIAWGGNRWVAGGGDSKMAYSADGVSWTAVEAPISSSSIAWGNNGWVAVGGRNGIAHSADGVSWKAAADRPFRGDSTSIYAIAYGMDADGSGRFVASGADGQIAYADW